MMSGYPLLIGKTTTLEELNILSNLANRHGLITGATGTGKTVTLQKLAEQFSNIGVPVFMADVKGDLSGIGAEGMPNPKLQARLDATGYETWTPAANPVVFWDVFAEKGHPVRATISDMGPLILSQLMGLNDIQSGILNIIFKVADDNGLLLIDFKDLRAMTRFVGENAKELQSTYGNIAAASIGAIQRGLLQLEMEGAELFFGEPNLDIFDFIQEREGRGVINILSAEKLYHQPKLYAMFLLWTLSELFERLPEVGDLDKPKIVFFFDEAHLLFNGAPKPLLDKIEQVVRLIRSKGVGIYFVTQSPLDIPDNILGQLGNRIQHALRAFTPRDQKAVRAAAQTMRANPALDAETAIGELGTGEALISFLGEKGAPNIVERAFILAPQSRMGILTPGELNTMINHSPLYGRYEEMVDRESAFEVLERREAENAALAEQTDAENAALAAQKDLDIAEKEAAENADSGLMGALKAFVFGSKGPRGGQRDGLVQQASKNIMRQITNEITRGVLGGRKRK